MTSQRPSIFNLQQREDGGPFLIVEPVSTEEGEGVYVFFTDVAPEQRGHDSKVQCLLHVTEDDVTIWPLNVRQDREDYLQPKYGSLNRIIVSRMIARSYQLPTTEEEVVELLECLPDGLAKDFRFGLGFLWEYRQIAETVAEVEGIDTLWLHGGDEIRIEPPFFMLGENKYHNFRKELNRITARYQRDARKEKQFRAHQALLHSGDPVRFPAKKKKIRADTIAEMTDGGRDRSSLSRQDRRAVLRMVQDNVQDLAKSEARELLSLKGDIELVTLNELIDLYREMLGKSLAESRWQDFFMRNPFILSLAFAVPAMLIQGQAYVGGRRIDGCGGKITDFLSASVSTGNLVIFEIKTPETELLTKNPYRGDDLYGPSGDFGKTIAQVLDQRFKLQISLPGIKELMNRHDIHGYAIKCMAVIGKVPSGHHQQRSFELIRGSLSEVVVITFDELLARLEQIKSVLQGDSEIDPVPF